MYTPAMSKAKEGEEWYCRLDGVVNSTGPRGESLISEHKAVIFEYVHVYVCIYMRGGDSSSCDL